jgi:hypothetical protein
MDLMMAVKCAARVASTMRAGSMPAEPGCFTV